MKRLPYLLLAAWALIASSCGDPNAFTIEGTVANNRTMNIRVMYAGDNVLNNVLTAARDGEFRFKGKAPKGALLHIMDNDYNRLADLYVTNGEHLKVFIDPADEGALTVKGSEASERLAAWQKENLAMLKTGRPEKVNGIVEQYVNGHPDDIVSTLLMVTRYDARGNAEKALALLEKIDKEARPAHLIGSWIEIVGHVGAAKEKVGEIRYMDNRDSMRVYSPKEQEYTLLAFSSEESGRRDSVVEELREISRRYPNGRRFRLLDVSVETDTFAWRRQNRLDSVDWPTAWVPGSIAAPGVERLGIPELPYFIIADSAGTQIYRGRRVSAIQSKLDSIREVQKKR